MDRNFGVIKIVDFILETDPSLVGEILAWMKFVPLRVECLRMNQIYKMEGYSQRFDLLSLNEAAPEYVVTVTQQEDGSRTFTMKRV